MRYGSDDDAHQSCAVCRFMRSLAFSAVGAGLCGYGALGLGASQENAILAASLGAVAAVVLSSRKKSKL